MLVLQALRPGARHGYGIAQAIRAGSNDILQIETGSLYPALHRLEKQSWIRAEWKTSEQDLRYALRQVRRAPGTFASAVLLIALGVAASTQVFAFVDAVLLRNLPVRDPQSLVQLFEIHPRIPARAFYRSFFLRLIREQSSTMTSAVGQAEWTVPVEHGGTTERVHPHAVTNDYFSALGVPAALGRVIAGED